MHQHVITHEQFMAIEECLVVFGRVNEGWMLTTIGKHPKLGACVLLSDVTSDPILLSEAPYHPTVASRRDAIPLPHDLRARSTIN